MGQRIDVLGLPSVNEVQAKAKTRSIETSIVVD